LEEVVKNIGELDAMGYGIIIFATDLFNEYINNKKWKAKKYISWFNKNKEQFHQIIKDGILFPIYTICKYEYEIFVKINEKNNLIPKGYKEIYKYNDFYMEVGNNNKLCFANFSFFENSLDSIKKNITEESHMFETGPDKPNDPFTIENYNYALGLDIEKGKYNYNIIGLKRINEIKRESKNHAFLFEFIKNENAINNNFNMDNEKYEYDIYTVEKNQKSD
jgi:hypothetical protein